MTEDFDRGILSYLDTHHIRGIFDFEFGNQRGLLSWRDNEYLKQQFTQVAIEHKITNPFEIYQRLLDDLNSIVDLERIQSIRFDLSLNPEMLEFVKESLFLVTSQEDDLIKYESVTVPTALIRQTLGSAFIRRFHDITTEYETLRQKLLHILRSKEYQAIAAIERFLKNIIGQDFVFRLGAPAPDGHPQIDVTIERAFTSPLRRISAGTIRLIALACILTADPLIHQIVIIDNPGLFLHPRGERLLARRLESLVTAKTHQFFLSTHSPRFLIGHAHLVELRDGWTNVERIRGKRSIRKIVKLLGIRPSDSLGSDVVVFVEGRTDARVLRVFEDKIYHMHPETSKLRISYTPVGGWTNMKYVLSLELLKTKFVRSRAVAITDGDIIETNTYAKIKQNWFDVFNKEGDFFSLNEECIESLFLNNHMVFIRLLEQKKDSRLPSLVELNAFIETRRNRGISDKIITRDIITKFNIGKRYSSTIAEKLAKQFKQTEIPQYLVDFFKIHILEYE